MDVLAMMFELFITFFKIGAVSFGGGYAMIPLVTEEVIAHGWMEYEQVINFIAVAESTPGPIAINMATFVGSTQGATLGGFGIRLLGACSATLGVVLPSFIIILLIASVMKNLIKYAGVQAFLEGIRPVAVGLIIGVAITMFLSVIFSLKAIGDAVVFDWKALIIFAIIALTHLVYKEVAKKKISPILLIVISAILGVVMYGVF